MQEDLFGDDHLPEDKAPPITLAPEEPKTERVRDGKLMQSFGTATSKRKARNKAQGSKAQPIEYLMRQLEERSAGLLSIISDRMKKAVLHIPADYINLDDDELRDKLKNELSYVPSMTVETLRTNFWLEFDRAQIAQSKNLIDRNIWFGACSESIWTELLNNHENWPKIAFIITKPPEYEANMRGLLNLATRRIRDILNIPVLNEKGEPRDSRTLDVILKAAVMVDMRAKGGYVQKVEQKNLSIVKSGMVIEHKHTHSIDDLSNKPIAELTHEEIQKRLDLLNAELAIQDQLKLEEKQKPIIVQANVIEPERPEPIDVTPVQKNKVDREIY